MDNGGDFLQLCRLCLVKDEVNIPIFEEQGDIRQIIQKISSCLPVKVSREDKLPKKICDGCSYKLDMVYEFWNTTANAEKQLLTWLGEAEMKSKLTENATSAVAQQLKPAETVVKQETIDPSDIHTEENDDDKTYMFQQKFSSEEAGPSATATSNDEPPPKRARRTAAVKAQIAMDPESDDDDDSGEPVTKVEDESEESEGEDHDASYADVPSTSADDQPGPSGVGKDGADAPKTAFENYTVMITEAETKVPLIPIPSTAPIASTVSDPLAIPKTISINNRQTFLVPPLLTPGYVRQQNNKNVTLVARSPLLRTALTTNPNSHSNVLVGNPTQVRPTVNLCRSTRETSPNTITTIPTLVPLTPTRLIRNTIPNAPHINRFPQILTPTLVRNSTPSTPQINRVPAQNIIILPTSYFSAVSNANKIITLPQQPVVGTGVNKILISNVMMGAGSQVLLKHDSVPAKKTSDRNTTLQSDKRFPPGYKNPFDYSKFRPPCDKPEVVAEPKKPVKSSERPNKWTCQICFAVKQDKESLLDHYEFHKEEKENPEHKNVATDSFECPACFKQLNTPETYRRHIKHVHGEKDFFCNICNRSYSNAYSLSLHNFSKHPTDSQLYNCCVCKAFSSKYSLNLRRHIESNHKKGEIYKCDVCDETFSSLDAINDHKIFHTESTQYDCKFCKRTFSHRRLLIAHNKQHHANKTNSIKKYKCDSCNLNFADEKALLRHERNHSAERSLCFVCGKIFGNDDKLKAHLIVHGGVKKFICNVCGRPFLKNNQLVNHLRTHSGEKPYKCVTCGKCFTQRTPLVIHQRHHTGERPYVCPTCNKGYVSKSALSIHRKTCK